MLHLPDEHTSEQHVCIVMFAILRKTVGTEMMCRLAALAYVC